MALVTSLPVIPTMRTASVDDGETDQSAPAAGVGIDKYLTRLDTQLPACTCTDTIAVSNVAVPEFEAMVAVTT